jgi:hypothetical protein
MRKKYARRRPRLTKAPNLEQKYGPTNPFVDETPVPEGPEQAQADAEDPTSAEPEQLFRPRLRFVPEK